MTHLLLPRNTPKGAHVLRLLCKPITNSNQTQQFRTSVLTLTSQTKQDVSGSTTKNEASPPKVSQQSDINQGPELITNPAAPALSDIVSVKPIKSEDLIMELTSTESNENSERGSIHSLNLVDPKTLSRIFYFDSLAFTKKLEAKGFTRDQAEGCVECLVEIIENTLEHQAKHMITKTEQKIAEQQLHTEIMSVKKDMVLLQKSEFSALRTETEKISSDITRIQSHFQDEVVKLKGQFTLDVNLERGRAVEAHAANQKHLQRVDNKIETEIAHLKTTYEVYRNDIFKYAAGTVLTCTTLIIGFIRLWK